MPSRTFIDSARPPTPLEKALIALSAALLNAAIYLVPNHVQLREPVLLPWTWADAAVPFVPATVWIYLSDYALVATAFFWCSTWHEVKRFTAAYLALLVLGATFHLAWPTLFPREAFPLVALGPTGQALAFLRRLDLPTSCLPSMHVAGSVLAALSLWKKRRLVFGVWSFWAGAVSVSTLTVKQHYLADVVAGTALAVGCWLVFFWLPELAARRANSAATAGEAMGRGLQSDRSCCPSPRSSTASRSPTRSNDWRARPTG